ncbi:MAG: DUF4347 domain-containing protein [Cyanobacteriota bacterium]|nr:DUF4347 domain-containing protein [Cyanobacteriota bacterium]
MKSTASFSNVIFIDSRMELDTSKVTPDTEVIRIDPTENGVDQISQVLATHDELASVQIIGHGNEGCLFLGNTELSNQTLNQYEAQVRDWGSALTQNGDLLLFGCDVAAGDIGRTFVQKIAELTDADVAASADLTGNADLGGDWNLEYRVGEIESAALHLELLETFDGILLEVSTATDLQTQIGLGTDEIELGADINLNDLGRALSVNGGNITIDGQGRTISGNDAYQIFQISNGTLNLVNVTLADGLAKGGNGTNGGGGGLGAGGAIYMNGGTLTANNVTFFGNSAQGGDALGTAGRGGNEKRSGASGGASGGLNGEPGVAGGAGASLERTGGTGGSGAFGQGGGGAGGGGGGKDKTFGSDRGGNGGRGGLGGWGAGGGGGGGGGGDDDRASSDDEGRGGSGGGAGEFGGAGGRGASGRSKNGGSGGTGGGGAGVGGAIFVRDGNVALIDSNFSGNTVVGGTGANNGRGVSADIYNFGGTVGQLNSDIGDSFGVDLLAASTVQIDGVTEPSESGATFGSVTNGSITLSLDRILATPLTLDYTLGGTATPGTDYVLEYNGAVLDGELSVPADVDTVTIDIVPTDDDDFDPGETIEFTLNDSPVYDISGTANRILEIGDNEPTVNIEAVETIREQAGTQAAFAISLDKPAPQALTIPYTVSGTATPGNDGDFAPLSGQVTIAAGQTQADISIEAFDDGTEEGSETIVLTLDEGSGYAVDEANGTARTLLLDGSGGGQPNPSDEFVRIEKTGSRTYVVEGSNEPDRIQILLVKEPTADVTISFETGDQLEAIPDITIPRANWSEPVEVEIYAQSDTEVEPEDIQTDLAFTLASADGNFNNLQVPTLPVIVADPQIEGSQLGQGIDALLDRISDLLAEQLDGLELPLIGNLGDYTPNFIDTFRNFLVDKLESLGATDSSTIATTIETAIEGAFNIVGIDTDVEVNLSAGLQETSFDITISNEYNLETDLSADLGIPALGLNLDGKAVSSFEYELGLGIGWHEDFGFYADTEKTSLKTNVGVALDEDFQATGNLGFLQLDATNNPDDPTQASIDFNVGLTDLDNIPIIRYLDANSNNTWDESEPVAYQNEDGNFPELAVVGRFDTNGNGIYDNDEGIIKTQDAPDDGSRLTLDELRRDFQLGDLFDPKLEGDANLGLQLVTSANGSSSLPSFALDLNVDWDGFSYQNGQFEKPDLPTVSFDNLAIDMGSFASNFARPIFGKVNEVIEPIRPFVDFLKQDISFFDSLNIDRLFGKKLDLDGDGKKSLVEFISILPQSKVNVAPFVDAIDWAVQIADLVETIANTEGNYQIQLGSYQIGLPEESGGFSNPNLEDFSRTSRADRFEFSAPDFSIEDFSVGLSELFDSSAEIEFSWPGDFSLGDFSGGLKQLFSQSGLRSTLNFDWSQISLDDFAREFAPSGSELSLGSIVGSSGVILRDFALGLRSLLVGTSEVSLDWSKFSLDDFATGLQAVRAGKAGRSAEGLNLETVSLQDFTNQIEPLFASGDFSLDSSTDNSQAALKTGNVSVEDQIAAAGGDSSQTLLDVIKGGTLEFPILTDPQVAIDLLLGKTDANLFTYDLPPLELDADFQTSFVIFSPPTVRLGFGGNVGIEADLAFGFDTQGVFEWSRQGFDLDKSFLVLDGLYASDRANADGTGEDVDEISAQLGAHVELGVGLNLGLVGIEGYARGGLLGELGLDFRDTGESTGTADGKIRAISEIGANITQPWLLFNLQGALSATAQIGIRGEAFFGAVEKDLYKKDFGPFTLAEFEYGENGFIVSTVFDGPIAGGTVFFDADLDGIQSPAEPFTLTQADGSYQLAIPLEIYDSNGNGQIDLAEGQIVVTNGVDVDTYQDQRFDFVTSPQWEVASPLTLLAMKLEQPDPVTVEAQIEAAFGLPGTFKLYADSPLEGIVAGDSSAAAVFRTQAQLQNLLILGSNTLGTEGDRRAGASALLEEIIQRARVGESIDLSDGEQLQSIIENAATALGVTPSDFEIAFDELVFLNGEIAKIIGSGESARADIVELIPYDILDRSYLNLIENPWISLLRAAVPEPDTAKAVETVQTALGLPDDLDIGSYNPIDEIANGNLLGLEIYAKQVQLNATWTQLAQIASGLGVEDADNTVIDGFVTALDSGKVYDNLGDVDRVADLLETLAPGLDSDRVAAAVRAIADRNTKINELVASAQVGDDLEAVRSSIAREQQLAQGMQANLLESLAIGETTVEQFETLIEYNQTNQSGITIENIIDGTENDDTLIGGDRNDAITGFAGNDLLLGNGGSDRIFGNRGNDSIDGGDGGDLISGNQDNDLLQGGGGFDVIFGNQGNDLILGGEETDFLYGGLNDDTLLGEAGDDDLRGDEGDDLLEGGDGNDIVAGGKGVDSLQGNDGDDRLFGNLGNDAIDGGSGNDTITGGKDDDVISGSAGDDSLLGNFGDDAIGGGDGDDTLIAGKGNDLAFGELGNDWLRGNIGDDTLDGGDGNDDLRGGRDNDILTGGLGDDSLTGGGGSDRFILTPNTGNDIIVDFTDGVDLLAVSPELLLELQQRSAIATATAEGAKIELGSGSVFLPGFNAAGIDVNDFVSLV